MVKTIIYVKFLIKILHYLIFINCIFNEKFISIKINHFFY